MIAQTDSAGAFEIVQELVLRNDGCFVLRAFVPPDTLPGDSVVLTYADLLQIGDSISDERIVARVELVLP